MREGEMPPPPRLPARQPGTRRAPRQRSLTREAIVEAAMTIVDSEGLDALTMRTVAHALGTGAASLYAHVANKEELVESLVERVIGEVRFGGEPDPARWTEQLKEMAYDMRAVFTRHRDLARASFGRIPLGENALRGSEWMIGVMRAGGLPDYVIGFGCDLIPLYVMAIAYEESLFSSEGTSIEDIIEFVTRLRDYFSSLPTDRFPNVVALAGALTAGADDTRFEFGLDVLLRGLAAMPAQSPYPEPAPPGA